jgi:hypothetical protein
VLLGFRQQRASGAKAAESIEWTVEDYIPSGADPGKWDRRPLGHIRGLMFDHNTGPQMWK